MVPIKLIVANNLAELRKSRGLTQQQLADKFSYSDKSVSKWEHGETLPDIETLKRLCDFYGVTLDFLVSEGSMQEKKKQFSKEDAVVTTNKKIIIALAVSVVWILATVVFVCVSLATKMIKGTPYICWISFVWALPATSIVLIVFQAKWGKHKWNSWLITAFIWSLIAAFYIQVCLIIPNDIGWPFLWLLFFIGVPCTIATFLYGYLLKRQAKRNEIN